MIIAKIKLSPGNAGWYDPLTNIHLTIAHPIGEVKAGMNTSNIKNGLAFRTIELIQGSLEEEEIIAHIEAQTNNEVIQLSTVEQTVAKEEEVVEQKIVDTGAIKTETIEQETILEESIEKEKPKKSSKKKAKA